MSTVVPITYASNNTTIYIVIGKCWFFDMDLFL